jgi:hypothetical protein
MPYGEKACEHFPKQILLTNAQNGKFCDWQTAAQKAVR